MRVHLSLDDQLVAELDKRVGPRGRSALIERLLRRAIDHERRWDDIEAALGRLADTSHEWDADPADWVRVQRVGDARRTG